LSSQNYKLNMAYMSTKYDESIFSVISEIRLGPPKSNIGRVSVIGHI